MPNSTRDTIDHIRKVQARLEHVIRNLEQRATDHDASKLSEPEKSILDAKAGALGELRYGTPEYAAAMAAVDMQPFLTHHYAVNDHHPQSKRTKEEEWRAVVDFDGYFEVSNFGEVRSVDRMVPRDGVRGDMLRKGQIRKPHITPKGYLRVQLSREGVTRNFQVHRLVAEAFIPNPENKPEVNHGNGNKQDNYVGNLEWATPSENLQHAYDMGLKQPTVKYVVHCEELDITTFGIDRMVSELHLRGYDKANSGAIWNCIAGDSTTHLGMTFTSVNADEYIPLSDIRFMSYLSILEMLADWAAAGERMKEGSLAQSLEHNKGRFAISDEQFAIMKRTIEELGW
jgi:hypothetical protein